MDGVAEFKVVTNPVSAEYGRVSGGLVQLVTKSGTNDFHGQLFDYNQNTVLNANDWNQNRLGGERPVFNQNMFGAAVGGPILLPKVYDGRSKTFFFFNYDGLRYRQGGELVQTDLPTEKMRTGDFTGIDMGGVTPMIYEPTLLDPQRYDPATGTWYRTILMGGDGQHIPANRIHPLAAALLKRLPLPNRAPNASCSWCGNYTGLRSTSRDSDAFAVRLDHALTDKQTIFGRFNHSNFAQEQSNYLGILQPAPSTKMEGQWGLTLNYANTISPTTFLDARIGGHYNPVFIGSSMLSEFNNSDLPFDPVTRSLTDGTNKLPAYNVASSGFPGMGGDSFRQNPSTVFEAAASLSKVMNRHTVKFGYEHRRWYDNQYQSSTGVFHVLGNATTVTSGVGEWSSQGQANAWPTYLLGVSGRSNLAGFVTRALNMNYHAAYVQDDFKVSSKLTLNLGLRWEMETPTTDRFDNLVLWDSELPTPIKLKSGFDWNKMVDQYFPATSNSEDQISRDNAAVKAHKPQWANNGLPLGGLAFVNTPEHPSRLSSSYHPFQFAPRLGVAYSVSDKTVVRASFAKVYLPTTGDPNAFGSTTSQWNMASGTTDVWADYDPNYEKNRYWVSTFSNPWPNSSVEQFQRTGAYANYKNTKQPSVGAVDSRLRQPYELVWNVGLQRELPGDLLVEVNYSGNRGVGLLGRAMVSRLPKDILLGGLGGDNHRRYSTDVENPFVPGQTRWSATETMTLGNLLTGYPYFGTVATAGRNIGTSVYQSLNLRSQKRFSQGLAFLFNYTLSNLKDDVGGPGNNDNSAKFYGGGGKWVQSVDDTREMYGTSIWDERHRLTATFDAQLPFGRNRRWLSGANPVLEGIVGGWIVAGNMTWRSGRPIVWPQHTDMAQIIDGLEVVGPAWADPGDRKLRNGSIKSWDQVFASPDRAPAFNTGILDITKLVYNPLNNTYGYRAFGFGDMTSFDGVRNPGSTMFDFSLMKRFPIFSDGTRYLQFRMEAQNAFNMRGYGPINIDPRAPQFFGFINQAKYDPRHIQVSLKLAF